MHRIRVRLLVNCRFFRGKSYGGRHFIAGFFAHVVERRPLAARAAQPKPTQPGPAPAAPAVLGMGSRRGGRDATAKDLANRPTNGASANRAHPNSWPAADGRRDARSPGPLRPEAVSHEPPGPLGCNGGRPREHERSFQRRRAHLNPGSEAYSLQASSENISPVPSGQGFKARRHRRPSMRVWPQSAVGRGRSKPRTDDGRGHAPS
jgi:hypothetical protein